MEELKTLNVVDEARNVVAGFVQRVVEKDDVEGVVLLGGISNTDEGNFIDEYSDIDLAIFLNLPDLAHARVSDIKKFALSNQRSLPTWLPEFQFFLPNPRGGLSELNVHQLLYSFEAQEHIEWSESKKEAYAYSSEIVFDRRGLIRKLIDEKTHYNVERRKERLIIIAGQLEWYVLINPERQIRRGRVSSAHDLLNEGVELIVESIYLYNRRFRPHKKWRLQESFGLEWTPSEYQENLLRATLILDHSADDVRRRVGLLSAIIIPLFERLRQSGILPSDPFLETSQYYDPDRQLLARPFADRFVSGIEGCDEKEQRRIKGFINSHLIDSEESLTRLLGTDANMSSYEKIINAARSQTTIPNRPVAANEMT